MRSTGKFILKENKKTNSLRVYDVETKKYLDMNSKEDVKQLVDLLNDYYNIVYDKWII